MLSGVHTSLYPHIAKSSFPSSNTITLLTGLYMTNETNEIALWVGMAMPDDGPWRNAMAIRNITRMIEFK